MSLNNSSLEQTAAITQMSQCCLPGDVTEPDTGNDPGRQASVLPCHTGEAPPFPHGHRLSCSGPDPKAGGPSPGRCSLPCFTCQTPRKKLGPSCPLSAGESRALSTWENTQYDPELLNSPPEANGLLGGRAGPPSYGSVSSSVTHWHGALDSFRESRCFCALIGG